jgi:hypothetical protein
MHEPNGTPDIATESKHTRPTFTKVNDHFKIGFADTPLRTAGASCTAAHAHSQFKH